MFCTSDFVRASDDVVVGVVAAAVVTTAATLDLQLTNKKRDVLQK